MAYDARTNELRELARTQIPTVQDNAPDGLQRLKEQKILLDAIDRWAGQRSTRLSRLPDIIEKMDGNAERAFYEETIALRAEMRPMFDCLRTSDVQAPSFEGLKIVTQGGQEEDKLQSALEACLPVASAMDAIVRYNRELVEKMDALKAKWRESEKIAQAIVRDEQTVLDEIAQVMNQAVDIEAELHPNAREKFRAWVKAAKDAATLVATGAAVLARVPPEIIEMGKDVAEQSEELITKPWETMAGDIEARKARYEDYFTHDHASLLVMFTGTREDAQGFVDKHDYTRLVLDWTSQGRNACDALRSAATTNGQKADAEALASRFRSALEKAEGDAKSRWDTFVSENKAKFFGALSPEVEKALLGSDWDIRYQKIASIDLQGLVQRWIGDVKRDFEQVDWSDVPESWRGPLRERMRESLDTLSKTEEEIARNNSPDALVTWIKGKATELTGRLR